MGPRLFIWNWVVVALWLQVIMHQKANAAENIAHGKPVFQSSIYSNVAVPQRAVDGNKNPLWAGASCACTNNDLFPWWAIDLGNKMLIQGVTLTNRGDCCGERLSKIQIGTTDVSPGTASPALTNYQVCNYYAGAVGGGVSQSFGCDAIGRYLVVQLRARQYLTLCEVEVYGTPTKDINLAKGKSAFQSSTYGGVAVPQRAVDGNTNSNWAAATCACTNNDLHPWWAVDLGEIMSVTIVSLTNRGDCCGERLSGIQIGTTDVSPSTAAPALTNYKVCNYYAGAVIAGVTQSFGCGTSGRYLVVQLKAKQYLTMCEVEVYGKPATEINLARGKSTFQSSIYGSVAVPQRAVDGNYNSNWAAATCACTNNDLHPWWSVDLGAKMRVQRVVLTNRGDCCGERLSRIQIGTTDVSPGTAAPALTNYKLCNYYAGAVGAGVSQSFGCGTSGRYLVVQLKAKQYLTICEVEVYGKPAKTINLAMGKSTFQSSTYLSAAVPQRAVDGNYNSNWAAATCACTNNDQNPWWAVDLGARILVTQVVLTNRGDCCGERLSRIQIGTTDVSPGTSVPTLTNYKVCSYYAGAIGAGVTQSFGCGTSGRYIVVQLRAKQYLTLCEVEVNGIPAKGINLASGKSTFQSSIYGSVAVPKRAVDGNYNSNWAASTCACTNQDLNPWWAVDLGARMEVERVVLTNRGDCCGERLGRIQIGTTDISPATAAPSLTNYKVCNYYAGAVGTGVSQSFGCEAIGRYLVVQLKAKQYLTLCEVEVYGPPPKVVELSKCEKEKEKSPLTKCTENGDYEKKQCNADKCWCVDEETGKYAFKSQKVPLGETYGCDRKVKRCEKARFKAIFRKKSYVPKCDDKGNL